MPPASASRDRADLIFVAIVKTENLLPAVFIAFCSPGRQGVVDLRANSVQALEEGFQTFQAIQCGALVNTEFCHVPTGNCNKLPNGCVGTNAATATVICFGLLQRNILCQSVLQDPVNMAAHPSGERQAFGLSSGYLT